MKGKKIIGTGIVGIHIIIDTAEAVALKEVCDRVNNDETSSEHAVVLASIVSNMIGFMTDTTKVIQEMVTSVDIYVDDMEDSDDVVSNAEE